MLPAEILADADAALTAGEAARGLHLIDHLLRTFPEHLQARTLRAQALLELGDEDGATADAATVLSADLLNVDALLISARLAEAQGDLHQGHALIGRAASIEPGHAGVRKACTDSVTMLPRDSAARITEPTLHAWGLNYYLIESDSDVDRISVAFEKAKTDQCPVACLIGAEYR